MSEPSEFSKWWLNQGLVQSIAQGSTKANALAAWLAAIAAAEKVCREHAFSVEVALEIRDGGRRVGDVYAEAIAGLREGR